MQKKVNALKPSSFMAAPLLVLASRATLRMLFASVSMIAPACNVGADVHLDGRQKLLSGRLFFLHFVPSKCVVWSGIWESNPLRLLGRQACNHQHLSRMGEGLQVNPPTDLLNAGREANVTPEHFSTPVAIQGQAKCCVSI